MRKLVLLFALTTILALALASCGGGESEAPTAPPESGGDAVAGEPLFQGTCSACHGPDGKGLPGLGKDLTTSDFAQGLSDQEMLEFVKQGRSVSDPENTTGVDMPPKGGNPALTDEQILDIIAYVRTLEE